MLSELRSQHGSQGIVYEPYRRPHFKLCVHEEPDVGGRNERYEFRYTKDKKTKK
jgi:hypothetical protein